MNDTFLKIRLVVSTIPKGKVTTYGTIATYLGLKSSQVVGWAIKGNQDKTVPCHRVVRKDGSLAEGFSLGGNIAQQKLLETDGIIFDTPLKVDLIKYFYKVNDLFNKS